MRYRAPVFTQQTDTFNDRLILCADDVCRLFGWNQGQLYMAVRRGQIPARKLGRRVVFLRTELEAHLAQLPHVAEEPLTAGMR